MNRRAITAVAGFLVLACAPARSAEIVAREAHPNTPPVSGQQNRVVRTDPTSNMPIKTPDPSIAYSLRVIPPPDDRHYTLRLLPTPSTPLILTRAPSG